MKFKVYENFLKPSKEHQEHLTQMPTTSCRTVNILSKYSSYTKGRSLMHQFVQFTELIFNYERFFYSSLNFIHLSTHWMDFVGILVSVINSKAW